MPRLLVGMAGSLLVALAAACGGGGDAPDPTPSQGPPERAPRPSVTPAPAGEPEVRASPTPSCPDPYPAGAPYEPTPGAPIRLVPGGSPPAIARYEPVPFDRDDDLEELMREELGDEDEHVGVYVKNLEDGSGGTISRNRSFYGASLYKTWVMLELFHQRDAGLLDFDEEYIVTPYYESLGLNAGEFAACERLSIEEGVVAMLSYSDNVAANVLLDRAGVANTNSAIRLLGFDRSGFVGTDLPTTAADMALLLEAIALGGALGDETDGEMLEALELEQIDNRLPALLPDDTRVAHKTGSWATATNDAGIVFSPGATYVIVVLTDYGFADNGPEVIAGLSRSVYDYYNP